MKFRNSLWQMIHDARQGVHVSTSQRRDLFCYICQHCCFCFVCLSERQQRKKTVDACRDAALKPNVNHSIEEYSCINALQGILAFLSMIKITSFQTESSIFGKQKPQTLLEILNCKMQNLSQIWPRFGQICASI